MGNCLVTIGIDIFEVLNNMPLDFLMPLDVFSIAIVHLLDNIKSYDSFRLLMEITSIIISPFQPKFLGLQPPLFLLLPCSL